MTTLTFNDESAQKCMAGLKKIQKKITQRKNPNNNLLPAAATIKTSMFLSVYACECVRVCVCVGKQLEMNSRKKAANRQKKCHLNDTFSGEKHSTHIQILKMESRPSKQTNLKQLGSKWRTATVELTFSLARYQNK